MHAAYAALDDADEKLARRVWRGQVAVLFPLVEEHRRRIVRQWRALIEAQLPLTRTFGERREAVRSLHEVEIGDLWSPASEDRWFPAGRPPL